MLIFAKDILLLAENDLISIVYKIILNAHGTLSSATRSTSFFTADWKNNWLITRFHGNGTDPACYLRRGAHLQKSMLDSSAAVIKVKKRSTMQDEMSLQNSLPIRTLGPHRWAEDKMFPLNNMNRLCKCDWSEFENINDTHLILGSC